MGQTRYLSRKLVLYNLFKRWSLHLLLFVLTCVHNDWITTKYIINLDRTIILIPPPSILQLKGWLHTLEWFSETGKKQG